MCEFFPEKGECVSTYSLPAWSPGMRECGPAWYDPSMCEYTLSRGACVKGAESKGKERFFLQRRVKTLIKIFTTKEMSVGTAGRGCRQERGGGAFGSVCPLRNAAFHLQHFRPAVVFVGFFAVLYVLEERDTGRSMLNLTHRAKVKEWRVQTYPPPPQY